MKKVANNPELKRIYLLRASDDMRHPYENALSALGAELEWFESLDTLLAAMTPADDPLAIIVDLECIAPPLEYAFEQLRTTFPNSDLFALSGVDSSQLALQCIRAGFTDFLLKPASPEEIAWRIRKSKQRHELFLKLDGHKTDMVRVVTQISTCSTATLVQLATTEYLRTFFNSFGAAWIKWDPDTGVPSVACGVPKRITSEKILESLPGPEAWIKRRPHVLRARTTDSRKIVLPCADPAHGGIVVWGVMQSVTSQELSDARLLVEHSENCIGNLQKFEQIKQQTFLDDLTGLYNARYLKFALTSAMARCKEPSQSFSVLFLDVDHFKGVNDKWGHVVGSEFLVAIGKTVKNSVRGIDPVFRYGGDEFVVILQDTPLDGAAEIAERLRRHIERRVFVIQGQRLQTTVSIGIAVYPEHASERETLLKLADEAMYSAKKGTRNAVSLACGVEAKREVG